MSVVSNLNSVKQTMPPGIKVVAVSKTNPVNIILEAYQAGQRLYGENKVQELVSKYEQLPKDIEWHLIGHLQTNKVKYIAPFVAMIHSIDSLSVLDEVNKQAHRFNRVIPCLLQVHIAEEETKFGLNEAELFGLVESSLSKNLKNVQICGLMGMATFTEHETQIRKEFQHLAGLFIKIKHSVMKDHPAFNELSMGMSSDYFIAIQEGSTMVRLGSKIFGERQR